MYHTAAMATTHHALKSCNRQGFPWSSGYNTACTKLHTILEVKNAWRRRSDMGSDARRRLRMFSAHLWSCPDTQYRTATVKSYSNQHSKSKRKRDTNPPQSVRNYTQTQKKTALQLQTGHLIQDSKKDMSETDIRRKTKVIFTLGKFCQCPPPVALVLFQTLILSNPGAFAYISPHHFIMENTMQLAIHFFNYIGAILHSRYYAQRCTASVFHNIPLPWCTCVGKTNDIVIG